MSLILEALRKSEADRRRGQAPDIHRDLPLAPVTPRKAVPAWAWLAAAALLAMTLLLLGLRAWQTRTATAPGAAPAATATRTVQPQHRGLPPLARFPSPVAAPTRAASSPATTAAAVAAHAATPAAVAAPRAIEAPEPIAARTPPSADAVMAPDTSLSPTPASPMPVDDTIALSDLSADARKALPPLQLSMHLWNTDPARRFVILDGKRLREGDRAGEAVVTSITEDGVILGWNGRRIRLSIR